MSQKRLLAKLKTETVPQKDILKELEELKEEVPPVSGFENVPSVSVNDNDLMKVEFLGEAEPRLTNDKKEVVYAPVKMLAPHKYCVVVRIFFGKRSVLRLG